MGPIVIIEDDSDDHEIYKTVFKELKLDSEVLFFANADTALEYLKKPEIVPFIIFSDVNMPGMNGFELRDLIHEDHVLRIKCIPYIFLTTTTGNNAVRDAYANNAQGFFTKPNSLQEWKELIEVIVTYWKVSKKP